MSIIYNDENLIVFVPQFTVDDDSIVFPFASVAAVDTAALSELIQIDPSAQFDVLTFDDQIVLTTNTDLSESALVSELVAPLEVTIDAENLFVSESVSPLEIEGALDSFNLGESILIDAVGDDSGLISEQVDSIELQSVDSSQLGENVDVISVDGPFDQSTLEETALFAVDLFSEDVNAQYEEFSGFAQIDPPDYDIYALEEIFLVAADLESFDEYFAFNEADITIENNNQDFITVEEFISLVLSDFDSILSLEEVFISTTAFAFDIFNYVEQIDLNANYLLDDYLLISEAISISVSASGIDAFVIDEYVLITNFTFDNATLSESVSISISTVDSILASEKPVIGATASDVAILTDLSNVGTSFSRSDSATLAENDIQTSLSSRETSTLVEIPFYHADYSRLDYIFLIGEEAFASILKEDFDSISFLESKPFIGLNRFELITFKEKAAIGIAQPLIINLNDDPTVHGTVTGDPIIISLGGTVPTLL